VNTAYTNKNPYQYKRNCYRYKYIGNNRKKKTENETLTEVDADAIFLKYLLNEMPSSTSVKAILNIKKYISVGFCEADAHICSSLEGVPGLIAFQSKNSGKPDALLSLLDVVPDGNMIKTVEATSTCRIQWILIYSGEKARPLLQWIKDHGSLKTSTSRGSSKVIK